MVRTLWLFAGMIACALGASLARAAEGEGNDTAAIVEAADSIQRLVSPNPIRLAMRTVDRLVDESSTFPQGDIGEESQLRPLTADMQALRNKVRRVLGLYYDRQLNSRDHNPWEMMHAIIAYAMDTQIHRGNPSGPQVNAIDYVGHNGKCHGLALLYLDRGRVNARKGPYVQGHYGQLLAILAQSRVPLDYRLEVDGKKFILNDLLETEKYTCDDGMELTFKLISFAHYCDSDATWKNFKGVTWSLPRIISAELAAPILSNAACGGTHRLTGLAYAVRNRRRQGKPIDGEWARAEQYLNQYHRYTLALQNSDGSFSTEWFRRREAKPDLDRRIQTSGHILEWLVYSLPADQLDHPQVVKAVQYLTNLLLNEQSRDWEIGTRGHAIHALAIYDARRFKPFDHSEVAGEEAQTPGQVLDPQQTVIAEPGQTEELERQPGQPGELSADVTGDLNVREFDSADKAESENRSGSVVPREARRPRLPIMPESQADPNAPSERKRLLQPLMKQRALEWQLRRRQQSGQPPRSQSPRGSARMAPQGEPTLAPEPVPAAEPIAAPQHGPTIESVGPGVSVGQGDEAPSGEVIHEPRSEATEQTAPPASDGPALLFPDP